MVVFNLPTSESGEKPRGRSMGISMGDFDGELRQSSNKLHRFCHIDEDFSCEACGQNSGSNTFSINSLS